MKFRNGFVSNSSSSSFLIEFPEKYNNKEEFKKDFPEIDSYNYALSSFFQEIYECMENNIQYPDTRWSSLEDNVENLSVSTFDDYFPIYNASKEFIEELKKQIRRSSFKEENSYIVKVEIDNNYTYEIQEALNRHNLNYFID